jgi:hypothetical protein
MVLLITNKYIVFQQQFPLIMCLNILEYLPEYMCNVNFYFM